MAQQVRVYLDYVGCGAGKFFEKEPIRNTEPGWPGSHYVDFELAQFREEVPVLKKGILKNIEKSAQFVAASITVGPVTDIRGNKGLKMGYQVHEEEIGVTYDVSPAGLFCTIWAPSITLLIKAIESLV